MSTFNGVERNRPDAVLTGVVKTDSFKKLFSNFTSFNFSSRLQWRKSTYVDCQWVKKALISLWKFNSQKTNSAYLCMAVFKLSILFSASKAFFSLSSLIFFVSSNFFSVSSIFCSSELTRDCIWKRNEILNISLFSTALKSLVRSKRQIYNRQTFYLEFFVFTCEFLH